MGNDPNAYAWTTEHEEEFMSRWREWDVDKMNTTRERFGMRPIDQVGALRLYVQSMKDRRFEEGMSKRILTREANLLMSDVLMLAEKRRLS